MLNRDEVMKVWRLGTCEQLVFNAH